MFLPLWILHVLVTVLFVAVLYGWAFKDNGTWDLLLPARILVTLLGYSVYWIIVLVIKVCIR